MPDVVMPRLSDTMEEGELSRWLKKEGDQIHKGDVLAEIETDKATMDLEAFDEGILEKLLVTEGTLVPIGQPLAVIGTGTTDDTTPSEAGSDSESGAGKETTDPAPEASAVAEPEPSDEDAPEEPAPEQSEPEQSEPGQPVSAQSTPAEPPHPSSLGDVRMSPLARRTARQHHLDVTTIAGTGPEGRIVRADVAEAIAAAEAQTPAAEEETTHSASADGGATPRKTAAGAVTPSDSETVPLSKIRRVTARRLTESQSVPHFFLTSVINAERLLALRLEINERLAESGTKISVNDLLVRACAVALRAHPEVNASWGDDAILRHHRINVGIAVSLDDGLIVPVITDADRKSVSEISAETRALAERARAGKLAPSEFSGGTFTISNLGMFGIDQFTAVINPPEVAILAVGAATEHPAVRDGQLVNVPKIALTLTVDHRVLDGATGAAFMRDLRSILEEPLRIVV